MGNISSDANNTTNGKLQRFIYNSNTLNTPYKQGITAFAAGWIESFVSGDYGTQSCYTAGGHEYRRIKKHGSWQDWYPVNGIISDSFELASNSAGPNGTLTWAINVAKTGYTPIGIIQSDFSSNVFSLCRTSIYQNTAYVSAFNFASSQQDTTGNIVVLYQKN